jgi:hypothetical protein
MATAAKTDTNYERVIGRAAARWGVAGDVRRSLEESRSRGLDFDTAWKLATDHLGGEDSAALRSTREHWRCSYVGAPPVCAALGVLRESRAA